MSIGKWSKKLFSLAISLVMALSMAETVWPAFALESAEQPAGAAPSGSTVEVQDEAAPEEQKTEVKAAARAVGDDDRLTNDEAYISEAKCTASVSGQKPFDSDNAPGNDHDGENDIIRSFDMASYTVSITNAGYNNAHYKSGMLYYEFVLPKTKEEAQFEISSMGWVTERPEAAHEVVETTDASGKPVQVLRGHFLWTPSIDNPSAIGAGQQDLNIFIRALAMHNGETLKPEFTFWLEGNQVPTDGRLVTGSGYVCPQHNAEEYKTAVDVPTFTVSAAPHFDVKLRPGWEQYYYRDTFDFNTGNDPNTNYPAPNKKAYAPLGRAMHFGVTVAIEGGLTYDGKQKGLRGCEMPKKGDNGAYEPITLQLLVESSAYDNVTSVRSDTKALVWSVDGNYDRFWNDAQSQGINLDGRVLKRNLGAARYAAPYNGGAAAQPDRRRYACYNGGDWVITDTQDRNIWEPNENRMRYTQTVTVTIKDFDIDLNYIPYTEAGFINEWDDGANYYFDPSIATWGADGRRLTGVRYWDAQSACFSAGELWVVQPFEDIYGNPLDNHRFDLHVYEGNLALSTDSDQSLTPDPNYILVKNQVRQDNDHHCVSFLTTKGGKFGVQIQYMKQNIVNWTDSMTDGCFYNGQDWCVPGQEFKIRESVGVDVAEENFRVSAIDQLVKWDDTFMEPTGRVDAQWIDGLYVRREQNEWGSYEVKPLWAAKKDGTGWNHNGKKPDEPGYDDEMLQAKIDDDILVYYNSLEELQQAGAVCVGMLLEWRGMIKTTSGATNALVYIDGRVKTDNELQGNVYAIAHDVRIWRAMDVERYFRDIGDTYLDSADETDYIEHICNAFPAITFGTVGTGAKVDYRDYTVWSTEAKQEDVYTYQKTQYPADGSMIDPPGEAWQGDSARVVSVYTNIQKQTAQMGSDGTPKTVYDLDANQTVADYVLYPSVHSGALSHYDTEDGEFITTVTIEDTLPKHLHYIPGSAYMGGQYAENVSGVPGTVTGGEQVEPIVTTDKDGQEVLRWTFTDMKIEGNSHYYMPPIYYSCQIAAYEGEDSLVNNEQLANTVKIWCTQNEGIPTSFDNRNMDTFGIQISGNASRSLSKQADSKVVNIGEDMGFTLNVGNNSDVAVKIFGVDSLPYEGDGFSDITGNVYLKEFKVTSLLQEVQKGEIKLYYTDDETQRGKRSIDYAGTLDENIWKELTVNDDGTVTLPVDFMPVALAAVGTVPGNKTLKLHLTLSTPDAAPGQYVINYLTCDSLESWARTDLASCSIEGVAWLDADKDGVRADDETRMNGVTAELLVLKKGGNPANLNDYSPYVGKAGALKITTGQIIDGFEGTITENAEGAYRFDKLPMGVYAVRFSDGTVKMSDYTMTKMDAGDDDTVDSDAGGVYVGSELMQAHITAIDLATDEVKNNPGYVSSYHDAGFVGVELMLEVSKVVTGNNGSKTQDFNFTVQFTNADGTPYAKDITYTGKTVADGAQAPADGTLTPNENGEVTFVLRHGQAVVMEGLPIHVAYKVTESEANKGGYKTAVTGSAECEDMDKNMVVQFVNHRAKTTIIPPPQTGDEGRFGLWVGIMAAAALGAAALTVLYFYRKKRTE